MKIKESIGPCPPSQTARHDRPATFRLPPLPDLHRRVVFLSQACYDSLHKKRSGSTRKRICNLPRKKHNLCIITQNILVVGSMVLTLPANLPWVYQRSSGSVQSFVTLFCRLQLVIAETMSLRMLHTSAASLYLFGV